MSTALSVIPSSFTVPAHLVSKLSALMASNDLAAGSFASYPRLSIKGGKWFVVANKETTPLYMPGTQDLAPSVQVVILKANPKYSKTFYMEQYNDDSNSPPTCSSSDGIRPDVGVVAAQNHDCATCKHNAWGSKVSQNGTEAKACQDSRRLAVLPVQGENSLDTLSTSAVHQLRVPAASLKPLATFGNELSRRKIPYAAAVVRMSFDPTVSSPKLIFTFQRMLSEAELEAVVDRLDSPELLEITGEISNGHAVYDPEAAAQAQLPAATPAPAPAVKAPAKAAKAVAAPTSAPAPTPAAKAPASIAASQEAATLDEALAFLDEVETA
jgi:hypothetical protein